MSGVPAQPSASPSAAQILEGALPARAAFESLVSTHTQDLMRLAWRFTRDAEEARDLVQATLVDAWERRQALRDAEGAGPWLRRILVNRAVNAHRRRRLWRKLQLLLPGGYDDAVSVSAVPAADAALDEARRRQRLHAEIARLPPKQAAAVTLRYLEGLPVAEVADALGVDPGTARVHLHRALRKLKPLRELEERGGP